jgi:predicted DCC family thiol-disulfide oxidoreductase YuxK
MPAASAKPVLDDLIELYRPQLEGRPILLFDGVCVFCNSTVQFLLRRDPNAVLRFVPLESPLGQQLLARFGALEGPEGIVLITEALTPAARLSRRTDAFLAALRLLPQPWRGVARAMRLVPRPLREFVYGLIARYRYRIFGRYATCPIPSPEQRARIVGIPS